jgi:hypothetical protein
MEHERQASRVVASRRARGARQRKTMPPLSRSQAASAHSDRAGGGHENPAASELATEPAADAPVRREVENDRSRYERRFESRHVRHRSAVLRGVRNDRKAGCHQCSPGVEQARVLQKCRLLVLIGVGSRRRSVSQAIDLPCDGGGTLGRLFYTG